MSSASKLSGSSYSATHKGPVKKVMFDTIEEEEQLPLHAVNHSNVEDSSPRTSDDLGDDDERHFSGVAGRRASSTSRWGDQTISTPTAMNRIRNILLHCRHIFEDFMARNAGLLLIVASQWFFAVMNLGVKVEYSSFTAN